jgi:hypothetical protein
MRENITTNCYDFIFESTQSVFSAVWNKTIDKPILVIFIYLICKNSGPKDYPRDPNLVITYYERTDIGPDFKHGGNNHEG